MDFIKRCADKARGALRALSRKINKFLDAAFPKKSTKQFFIFFVIAIEVVAAYLIAYLQVGVWIEDYSVPGMVAAYIRDETIEFPFLIYLLLSVAFFVFLYFRLKKDLGGNTGRGFDISESNVYGSAQEISREDLEQVADIVPVESATEMIFGKMDKNTTRNLITAKKSNPNFNRNVFCLAPPGSGKTHCISQPAIVQAIRRGESVVTTDTKGDLWANTVELARSHGYLVRRIDFKDPRSSDGWDVLGEVRHDDVRAKIFAQIYMANTDNGNDIHASAEENLLAALAMYTDLNAALPSEQKTLYNVYTMLMQGYSALDQMFSLIQDDPEMRVAYDSYASFQGSENLRNNIIAGLAKRLNIVTSPAIREMTSTPDVDLTLPGQRKCIYYVEMPDQHKMTRCLASLFFSFLFLDLVDYADSLMTQRLPVPVSVIIEEAYAVGKIPTITDALGTVRSRGIGITLIAQDIPQFRELYGDNLTEIIQDCCATSICLSANGPTTAQFFSWLSGTATARVKTEHHSIGEGPVSWGRSYTTGEGRRELFSENDVRKIDFGEIFIVFQRKDPFYGHVFGIHEHPEFIKGRMPKVMPTTQINILDREARAFLRAKEEERVMLYEQWIKDGGDPWPDYTEPKPKFKGPASGTPLPEVIPYPELERMALAHSAQATVEASDTMLRQLQGEAPIPAVAGFEPPEVPPGFTWEDISEQNNGDDGKTSAAEKLGGDEKKPPAPHGAPWGTQNGARPKEPKVSSNGQPEAGTGTQKKSSPTILEKKPSPPPTSLAGSMFGLPEDEGYSPFRRTQQQKPKKDKLQANSTKIES